MPGTGAGATGAVVGAGGWTGNPPSGTGIGAMGSGNGTGAIVWLSQGSKTPLQKQQ